MQFLNCLIVSS